MSTTPRHITIDLDRLRDASYMEAMTGTEAYSKLEEYFRDTVVVNLLEQIRVMNLPESTKEQVIHGFLKDLPEEARARISSMLKVSDLLDTLIDGSRSVTN